MNHLEQLVAEWLQYNGYHVKVSIAVGARSRGGFEGELDVVGFDMLNKRLLHVECSLDALSEEKRETRFGAKFDRGKRYMKDVFKGIEIPVQIEQVALLQFHAGRKRTLGGARIVLVRELIHEVFAGLEGKSPSSKAVPSHYPLLRTLQLAAYANRHAATEHRLIRAVEAPALVR